jgi:hypothetical protein
MKFINNCVLAFILSALAISVTKADERKTYDIKCWNPDGTVVFDENVVSLEYSAKGGPWFEVTFADGKIARLFNLSCRIKQK